MAHSNVSGVRKASRYHRLDDIPTNTFTPQTYQIQLLDAALKKNTLLCLGCSQSKVFLALMVIKELASSTRHFVSCSHKVTIYLTDSEAEADNLYQTLPHHTDLQIGCCPPHLFEGSCQTESTALIEWRQLMELNNILICYGPVFLAAVQNNYVRLKDVNLLVFDECHRSVEVEDHPYAEIVAHVRTIPLNDQPHILGVTASIAGTECDNPSRLRETIDSMEKTMHAYAETSMLILSERFGCRPKESVIKCIEYEYDDEQLSLRATLEDLLEQNYYFFSNCNISVNDEMDKRNPIEIPIQVLSQCLNVLNVLGTWCTSSISEYFVMQLEKIVKCEKNEIHKRFLRCVITTLRQLTKEFEIKFHPDYDVDELLEYTTPRVRELVKVLRNYKPELDFMIISNGDSYNSDDDFSDISDEDDDDDDSNMSGSDEDGTLSPSNKLSSKPVHVAIKRTADGGHERILSFTEEEEKSLCGIVFVENRYIAFGLNKVIEEVCSWDENLCFVKSCHITGQGIRGTNGKQKVSRNFKRQEEALRKFRTQECNLVIATLELEEGVDIPKCNLVVRFDPPEDYRSYTLSKGRARARDASFVILLDQQNYDQFDSSLRVFKGIEQVLLGERTSQQTITDKMDEDSTDDEQDNETDDDIDEDDLLPPYCTIPGFSASPQVTMQGAIALINRYCAKLPSDAFTHLTPHCRLEKLTGDSIRYIAFLRLPINSPIKEELKGPPMKTKKLARMAVALKMCEILHGAGELDENLLPVGKEMFLYEEEEEWADEEDLTGQARPGTTKRKQYYVKKVADALVQSLPKKGESCFLYLINLRLTGPITDEQNTRGRVIYAPEDTLQTLGILLSQRIPEVPNFPVYTRSGEVTVSIDLLQSNLTFTENEISRLLKFHHFVFSCVLHLEKDPMEFNPEKADCGLVIVPLNGKDHLEIEWPFVDKVIQFLDTKKPVGFSRRNQEEPFVFCVDEFKDAVVMPSYRNIDQPQHFYVAEILHDLNPLSQFPSPELYKTFQDYYTTKYGLVITNTEQPLLDVDHTSARLNLLTPRYMNQKGVALPTSSAETKRARRENLQQKQILLPELCDIHVFPASLWRKTVCLPAVLYRANNLLLAEELRCKIARETGIGVEKLPEGFRFSQLDFGFETSPEKLKELELSSGKKVDQSVSSDVKNIRTFSERLENGCRDEDSHLCTKSMGNLKCEELIVKSLIPRDKWETSKVENESILERELKTIDEKIDSSSSSDSDSGIVSSGSDTNIETPSSRLQRESADRLISSTETPVSCGSKTGNSVEKSNSMISKQTEVVADDTSILDRNLSPWCSDHDYICNITSQGSPVSNTHGNGHNQCNIIYTSEVSKPLSNSSVNGQPLGRSSTASTSSVIKSNNVSCAHTTISATNSSSSASDISSVSFIDASTNITSIGHGICEVKATSVTYNVFTAASVTINCSNANNKLPAAHGFAGAKNNAAVLMPCLTSSALTAPSSYASSSVTAFSLSDSCQIPSSTPIAEITPSEKGDLSDLNHLKESVEHILSPPSNLASSLSVLEEGTTSCNSINSCVSTSPSTAALNKALYLEDNPNGKCSITMITLNDSQGCEFLESSDSHPALFKELHPEESYATSDCDTCTNHESTSDQIKCAPTLDHSCVHQSSAQKVFANSCTPTKQNHSSVTHKQLVDTVIKNKFSTLSNQPVTDGDALEEIFLRESKRQEFANNNKLNEQKNTKRKHITTSKSSQPVSSQSDKRESDSPAIIMNTLGQELSGLDIDLIIPQADTSETFHESHWGSSCNENENHKEPPQWDSSCRSNSQDSSSNEKVSKSDQNEENSEVKGNVKEEYLKTHHFNASSTTDADIIKFSFATDNLENSDIKNNFNVDNCMPEPKNENGGQPENLINKQKSSNVITENVSLTSASSVSSLGKTSSVYSSRLQPSESTYPAFDIGVWNKKTKVCDKLHWENSLSIHAGNSLSLCSKEMKTVNTVAVRTSSSEAPSSTSTSDAQQQQVSLDEDRNLQTFIGPSPCLIMQALTMSNANDFFSLERLETIGDSFLKYAITVYLYCSYPGIHEGKLSYLRSKQVSNYNLYRLGRRKCLAECMVSTKFEPYENWLPPGYIINEDRRRGPVPKVVIVTPEPKVTNASRSFCQEESSDVVRLDEAVLFNKELEWIQQSQETDQLDDLAEPISATLVPYSLQRHHGLPDKSVADCVEAFIGCYLTTCGRKAALMFMSWLGLKVLPKKNKRELKEGQSINDSSAKVNLWKVSEQEFDELRCPPSPMFSPTPENLAQLEHLLEGFSVLEEKINYKFRDRSYLLQAFTHASYHYNVITDCYQRIEFLGDAILDYVITRHLYEDSQKYSPGILTDLRSALVNNNIFAALAVKWGFHKYFKAISPSLFQVIDKFVKRQKEKNQDDIDIDEEYRELSMEEQEPEEGTEEDDEEEEVEMEIPKALGDIFESVAGAIYLDSQMSLDTVWRVYYRMMKPHIDKYLKSIPKSPVRELLETEPETAKFERPERTMNGKVRVTVNVVGKGTFSGVGRNYRIAKSAAAKKALRSIRIMNQNLLG